MWSCVLLGLERSPAATVCPVTTYFSTSLVPCRHVGRGRHPLTATPAPPAGTGQTADLFRTGNCSGQTERQGFTPNASSSRRGNRSQGSSVSRPQATEQRGRSAAPGPRGSPASCLRCERPGVDAPDLRPRAPPTLRPDPLLPPHTGSEQRLLILGGPPPKAKCPHPLLPGLGKTRASVSARPKGAHLQY